jgi:hypothetical protein
MGERPAGGQHEWGDGFPGWPGPDGSAPLPSDERLIRLMTEFRRRQQRCPNLVVRPWWTTSGDGERLRVGFVVEYCPHGRESAELVVRQGRVTVDGPAATCDATLDLVDRWELDGVDTRSPETLANHLLRLADGVLGEEEAA